MTTDIPISLVLNQQDNLDVDSVCCIAREIGIEPTVVGRATISARISAERFEALFGCRPETVLPSAPGTRDLGRPGGFECEQKLSVPEVLQPAVSLITVAPPALRLY